VSDRLVDAREIAELLGVPTSWVRDHTRGGEIPHVPLGRYVRYREADVLAWVDSIAKPGRTTGLAAYSGRRKSPRAARTAEGVTTPKE
jgi:excisionase family DNA binding protein